MKKQILKVLEILFLISACVLISACAEDEKDEVVLNIEGDNEMLKVTCRLTEQGGAVDGSHCRRRLFECSDDKEYSLECVLNSETNMTECSCIIDDNEILKFETEAICPIQTDDMLAHCGWKG